MPSIYRIDKYRKTHDDYGTEISCEFIQYCCNYSEALRIVEVLNTICAENVWYQVNEVEKIVSHSKNKVV